MPLPTAVFESCDPSSDGWSACFGRPRVVRQADTLAHVRPLLDFLEEQVRRGRWGVLLLSYEAAGGVNPSLSTARPGAFPLAWAAVYDRPQEISPPAVKPFFPSPWTPALNEEKYTRAVRFVQKRIAQGDTYQVNLTFPLTQKIQSPQDYRRQGEENSVHHPVDGGPVSTGEFRLRARWTGEAWAWYRRLAAAQGAPYSAFVDGGRWKILSLSPELFFEKRGNLLTVRPMKGSAPRGRWDEEDRAFAQGLRASAKERAENVMIVDLLRNDLGKIARAGSVRTTKLFQTEAYPTLWQMTSEIKARLRPDVGLGEMMTALFPSGSVTGAPKRRTMEIIRDLEMAPRGLYTGTLGLLRPNGHWTFSVVIRTLTLNEKTGEARCPVGSGITAASRPADEYRECLLKGDFLNSPPYHLFESLRLDEGKYFLLKGHLDRLRGSAMRLGFPWNGSTVRAALREEAQRNPRGLWKIRLLFARDGQVRVEKEPLITRQKEWRVTLATTPVDDRDIFLYHKTTHREVYDRHRRAHPKCDDVILWNRRGELTESTVANLVVEVRGRCFTPPVRSGLLNGVYRQDLLRRGRMEERVLTREDLRRAKTLFLVNSVRGAMVARLE